MRLLVLILVPGLCVLLASCPSPSTKSNNKPRAARSPAPEPPAPEPPAPPPAAAAAACTVKPGPVLGRHPLCEASAALPAPWDPATILVADNELAGQLFAFRVVKGKLEQQRALQIEAGGEDVRVKDVEALASVGDKLLVVGSHSRNKRCCGKKKRRRLQLLASRDGKLEVQQSFKMGDGKWAKRMASVEACLDKLFASPADGDKLPRQVCEALVAAEKRARCDCQGASCHGCDTLNIEGAVAVGGRIWLGLRAPLVKGRAALLRLALLKKRLRFDAAALLELDGNGVRELALANNRVHVIAGPPLDSPACFWLWSLAAERLRPGALLTPDAKRWKLPTSSEGLLIQGGKALVTIDGAEGDEGSCEYPSRQFSVDLSR